MVRIGINGFGRIGRAVFRHAMLFDDVEVVAINDVNPEVQNVQYLLKYDSLYGRFPHSVTASNGDMLVDDRKIKIFQQHSVKEVPWADLGCDVVVEASGVHSVLEELPEIIAAGVKKTVVTHSPDTVVQNSLVLGVNEHSYDPDEHHIISSSICDVVAFAPIYKIIDESVGVDAGFLTTLHPWLAYQNLLDGPSQSWSYPGKLYGHYALGRASTQSLILKPTSAIPAADKVLPGVKDKIECFSYRVPTPIVGAADITFHLKTKSDKLDILREFTRYIDHQKWPILHINHDPLVSIDFTGTDYSAVIDTRWFELVRGDMLKVTLWYDNEWGYSRRVVDIVRFVSDLKAQSGVHQKQSSCGLS